jgi:copper chaperone CopZ
MTTKILGLFTMLLVVSFSLTAKEETVKFPVKGECGMCEKRIVDAATSVIGVNSADWEQKSQTLQVSFNDNKTNVKQIQTSIAIAGHDTELFNASDNKYSELPGCCQYQRGEKKTEKHHAHESGCSGHEKKTECSSDDKSATSGSCCGGK